MTRLASLALLLACSLPAFGQGLILGAPAQGASGGGDGTVDVTGSGLTGDGSAGDPLTLGAVLQALSDLSVVDDTLIRANGTGDIQGSDATLSDAELLDLSDTGAVIASFYAVGTGVTSSDVRLKLTSAALAVRLGDDSGGAPVIASRYVLSSADTNGWAFNGTSSVLTIHEGDSTDPSANESVNFGATTGWASIQFSQADKANPTYGFVGDLNTGSFRPAADTWAVSTGGVQNLLLSATQLTLGLDGTASAFAAELFVASSDTNLLGIQRSSTDTTGATIQGYKTRGSPAALSDIATGDNILSIHANARIASALEEWGRIECSTDGTIGTGDRPSKWSFYTVPDASNTLAEVFRIDQAGDVRVYGGDVFLATLDASGWKLETSASRVSLLEGDGTALTAGDEFALGSTTGDPMLRSNPGATNGGFCFVGDNNTTMYRSGADTLAFATGGSQALSISSTQVVAVNNTLTVGSAITPTNDEAAALGNATSQWQDFYLGGSINTTSGDSATINKICGRFRKDSTGTTFTLTNSLIRSANSVVMIQFVNYSFAATTACSVVAASGSATITFNAAPAADLDCNFLVVNID